MRLQKYIFLGLAIILFVLIFIKWTFPGDLSSGDWPYLYPSAIYQHQILTLWDPYINGGFGQSVIHQFWFNAYALTIVKLANILSWSVFERLVWFFPFAIISLSSSFLLAKKINKNRYFSLLSSIIYTTNTYILMVVAGGQVGVMMAYSVLPLALFSFTSLLEDQSLRKVLIFSVSLAVLTMFDLRVVYMFLFGSLLFFFPLTTKKKVIRSTLKVYIWPIAILILLHSYWILPLLLSGGSKGIDTFQQYTSSDSLSFFSFAKLENSVSLLHPNWPENLFGKVSFLRPEFMIFPFLAFLSLLFVGNEKKKTKVLVVSFALLGLTGAFLAKGTNDPFGFIYKSAFEVVPGFNMFRDPTKWYMLVALSFSVLVPYTLEKASAFFSRKNKSKNVVILMSIGFLLFWSFSIRDVLLGRIGGTLKPRDVPENYKIFSSFLNKDKEFYRTLWVPAHPTFAYFSTNHPAISGINFFDSDSIHNLVATMSNLSSEKVMQDAGIRYVVVPDDIEGKLFVNDRKYNEGIYEETVSKLRNIDYLSEVKDYGKIKVFEVDNPKGHFWGTNSEMEISFQYLSPTRYVIDVGHVNEGDILVFSESYDSNWFALSENMRIPSLRYPISKDRFVNGFKIPQTGSSSMTVYYKPQDLVNFGLIISGASLALIVLYLIKTSDKKKA